MQTKQYMESNRSVSPIPQKRGKFYISPEPKVLYD